MADSRTNDSLSRRNMLGAASLTAAAAAVGNFTHTASADDHKKGVTKGNINQSVVFWCFNVAGEKWDLETQCKIAKQLGCKSIELVGPDDFPTLKKHGLTCAISGNGVEGPPFMRGLNNLKYHDMVINATKKVIDKCAEFDVPSTIAFNGYKWHDAEDANSGEISLEEGARNCVEGLKKLAAYGEKKKVTINIEMLNTRDDTHPMKGHPGYQGDDMDYVADIVMRVGSPRVKILFDIYHVQIMNGDVIRRIGQYAELIGHIHTAGNPGRGELHLDQEINYAACMKALLDNGYKGFVGQEFIPTMDPMVGLTKAVQICDV